jgi:predicted ATPase
MLCGELDLALRLDEDLVQRGRQSRDPAGIVLGCLSFGRDLVFVGRLEVARSHLEEALAGYDPVSHRSLVDQVAYDLYVSAQANLGFALVCLGYPDQALAHSYGAISEARKLAHLPSIALALGWGTMVALIADNSVLGEWADQMVAIAAEQRFSFWRAYGTICHGWVELKNRGVMEGIALLRSGLTAYRATGAEMFMSHHIALLARACGIAGQIEEGLTLVDDALQIVQRRGERWFAAELNRHKGELLLRQGHAESAEELYRKALSIAGEQAAKLWELRAAVSLARLRRDQGRHAEARDLLAPVYGWFTEGFDTADLKAAKALLDELNA